MLYKWNIVGHTRQLESLENDIKSGNISHAYIFTGPDKMGKFTVARTLAHILQCQNNFCRKCPACIQIEKGTHPDTIEMRDDQKSIKIEQIRDIIARLNMTSQGAYKIVMLENTARMTLEAMNSLLKILEEPPPKTIFILTVNNLKNLPETIVSRSRIVKFSSFSDTMLFEQIKGRFENISEEEIKNMCNLAMGRPGKVFNFAVDFELFNYYKNLYSTVLNFLKNEGITEKFKFAEELSGDPQKINDFLDILTHLIRTIIIKKDYKKFKENYSDQKLIDILNKIFSTKQFLKRNINSRLLLENLMLNL